MRKRLSCTRLMLLSVVLFATCVVLPCPAEGQDSQNQQDQSVADAARRSRERKNNPTRQSRVITNDDLDMKYFKPGEEGLKLSALAGLKTEAPSASGVAAASSESLPVARDSLLAEVARLKEQVAEDAEIAKLKEQIAEAEEHLKWQQRELALDQDTVYSNPNYTDSKTGKARLDSEQQRINERQQEIEGLKAHLAVLQERRRQAVTAEIAPPDR
jgi:chromosome segregation ATPase